jgi:hypothetical protein
MTDEELVNQIIERLTIEGAERLDDKLREKLVAYAYHSGDLSAEELTCDLLENYRHDLSHEEIGNLLATLVCALWWSYVPHPE